MEHKRPLLIALAILTVASALAYTIAVATNAVRWPFILAVILIPILCSICVLHVLPLERGPQVAQRRSVVGSGVGLLLGFIIARLPEPVYSWVWVSVGWFWAGVVLLGIRYRYRLFNQYHAIDPPPRQLVQF